MEDYLKKAIEQMKRGDEKGFNTVYSATYNRVYFRAKQIMKKEEDAQDLTQIVFTEAYKCIHTLQTAEALYSWLDGITYHQGMKIYRKQKDVLLTEEAEGIFEEMESNDISSMPELTADQQATADIIKGIIEELPELQRAAVVAYYYDGLKVDQIAEMMECSVNTVKSRLNYARKYMKSRVEEKEKEEGYRLHVFGRPVLWYALKTLAEETSLSAYAAQNVYNMACSSVGLQATTISISSAGAAAGTSAGMATGATTGAASGTTAAGVTQATAAVKGSIMNTILKNVLVAGVGFGLSFVGAFGISQMAAAPIEITSVEEAQAILDGQKVDTVEGESEVNTEAEPVQDEKQDAVQETLPDATNKAVEGEIYFDWSFDDWRYNGVHISEGVEAVARSFGLDTTSEETDYVESEFGRMSFQRLENEVIVRNEENSVWHSYFADTQRIQMNSGIFDESGNPVDVSDITSVPFTAGSKEEAEAFFHIPEIMEIGEKEVLRVEKGIEVATYDFSSNLGEGELFVGWSEREGEVRISYRISFSRNGEFYAVNIWSSWFPETNNMYYTMYEYRENT